MNMAKSSVKYLQSVNFKSLTVEDKSEIKRLGRETPDLDIQQLNTSRNSVSTRKFNTSVYSKHKWLCGCPEKNALFCFPCLLFEGDTSWTREGVTDLKHLGQKIKKHENSAKHLRNGIELSMLGKPTAADQFCDVYRQQTDEHNVRVRQSHLILWKIIDCIKFCGKYGIPLRRHDDEVVDSSDPGMIRALLEFTGKLNESLKSHFSSTPVFTEAFEAVQDQLLDCMLEVCLEEIRAEVKQVQFLAVISDDASEASSRALQVLVLRYESNGTVRERFWGFFNPIDQKAAVLADLISEQLNIVLEGDNDKLIAQTYDCAAVFGKEKGGVHTIIQQNYKYAHFVHCYAHPLNLIVEKVAAQDPNALLFFSNLAAIPAFLSKSVSRLAVLNDTKPGTGLFNTRWDFKNRLVYIVFENKKTLIEYFEKFLDDRSYSTVQEAAAIAQMLNDDDFNFWLEFFNRIMPHVDVLINQLQEPDINSGGIYQAVNSFVELISEDRNSIALVVQQGEETPSKKIKMDSYQHLAAAVEICDAICFQIKERFAFNKHLSAAKLLNFSLSRDNINYSLDFVDTIEAYPFLCNERLKTELSILSERPEFRNLSGLTEMLELFYETGIGETCSEVFTLLKIILTTPMTTAEPERCFSILEKVKKFLENTSADQDRQSALAMLNVESAMIEKIANFNEKVINKFASREEWKADFMFK